ncbi:MAG: family 10 glycosylhydrolase [Phycisphaerae bacterium]|nr:family 10 glycosylhydrolase [Phycisphaerae bacterium]
MPGWIRSRRILFLYCVLPVALAAVSGCHGLNRTTELSASRPVRAVWVTRWDYRTPSDIAAVMENCRRAGFTDVLFQVRGAGAAFYRSRLEPWADELGGHDPGFDPLSVACREAHKRGVRLHAWANVMPAWYGKKPPGNPRQLYNARPEWFLRDENGQRQPLGWYCSLNPTYPEVRRYLTDVMREIVARYPIDGLHLDYIRLPVDPSPAYAPGQAVPDYPRDRRTLASYQAATGKRPDDDPALWTRWRAAQVTRLVADIRAMQERIKPGIMLSAAVGADPERSYRAYYQDSRRWLAQGLVDAVFPMNYDASPAEFERRARDWAAIGRGRVVQGIMFDKRPGRIVREQLQCAHAYGRHYAIFAYNSLFERRDDSGRLLRDAQSPSREELRREVIPVMHRE